MRAKMGRKPNALILQHFERGAKLPDSSNRYQHTCKACGEKFPKGRIDSLTNHLVKKCPALSLEDRQKALLELNNLPQIGNGAGSSNRVLMSRPTVDLPINGRPWEPMTALSVLAEASRQMDLKEKHDERSVHNRSVGGNSRASEPPRADKLEVYEQYTLDNPPVSYEQREQREQRIQREKKAPNHNHTAHRRESEASLPPANFAPHMTHSRSTSPNLAMAATSMAAAAAARFAPSMTSMVDPQLLNDDVNTQLSIPQKTMEQELNEASAAFSENIFSNNHAENQLTWPMIAGSGVGTYQEHESIEHSTENNNIAPRPETFPRPLAMNSSMTTEFSAEYGNGQRPNKPKVRGRFTPTRRKEVQEVRKKGACIRCRMLKKPCSDGDPCTTCQNVESARLWKNPCIRTRLADDFEMYSSNLHTLVAYQNTSQLKAHITFHPSAHPIEASHYPDTTVYATFSALEGQAPATEGNIDPGLGDHFSSNTVRILDGDNDDLPSKLDAYTKRMSSIFFDQETSHFMNVTLNTAKELAVKNQDPLLEHVLALWSIVHILVDNELHWSICHGSDADGASVPRSAIDRNKDHRNYNILCLQLNAAAEKKASVICKGVLNDLERRLLQRSSQNSFETFLVAVIMLNCVEKSTWLYRSWEQASFIKQWPFDKSPAAYISQGDSLTNMLIMLLKMRQVPPKTYARAEDGIITTNIMDGPREYFEKLQLNYIDVLNRHSNHVFDPANSRCYEFLFCSKLFLPTT